MNGQLTLNDIMRIAEGGVTAPYSVELKTTGKSLTLKFMDLEKKLVGKIVESELPDRPGYLRDYSISDPELAERIAYVVGDEVYSGKHCLALHVGGLK